ncbi:MAG: hypothetical protein JNL28_10180 [Planctomycetes bacterium]|nr:hypothetical protein [Planctomycetota bacterium]
MESVDTAFPPRREWIRLGKRYREGKSSQDVAASQLLLTTTRKMESSLSAGKAWAQNLRELIGRIRELALNSANYRLPAPSIVPVARGDGLYRPIALLRNVEDRVICSQTAKYLRTQFDPDFMSSSYAFRVRRGKEPPPTHHDAVRDVERFRSENAGPLWVAECDIQSFFDAIHHDVAWRAFCDASGAAARRGVAIDPRAVAVFSSFLNSYTFFGTAAPKAREWLEARGIQGELKSPRRALENYYSRPESERVGIPQGGALSCLVANLVLHRADRAVATVMPSAHYARYCDDMVLLSTSRSDCDTAFQEYVRVLHELRLPCHPPRLWDGYSSGHWTGKSKNTYPWGPKRDGHVPWLSFVGYQVRHDGLFRVRKSTLQKELDKQERLADDTLQAVLAPSGHSSPKRAARSVHVIEFRLRSRLLAMSVGTRGIKQDPSRARSGCWSAGFPLLVENRNIGAQMKLLDRGRQRQLLRVRRILGRTLAKRSATPRTDGASFWAPSHYGRPYSYFVAFQTAR